MEKQILIKMPILLYDTKDQDMGIDRVVKSFAYIRPCDIAGIYEWIDPLLNDDDNREATMVMLHSGDNILTPLHATVVLRMVYPDGFIIVE